MRPDRRIAYACSKSPPAAGGVQGAVEGVETVELMRFEDSVLTPRPDGRALDATLFGALATLLSVSAEVSGNKKPSAAGPSEGQLSVVAGACNHRKLTLSCPI